MPRTRRAALLAVVVVLVLERAGLGLLDGVRLRDLGIDRRGVGCDGSGGGVAVLLLGVGRVRFSVGHAPDAVTDGRGVNRGVPSDLELAARVGISLLLGGLIGLERELTDQTAGLRTHISVCLGAALFAIVSAYGWDAFDVPRDDTVFQVDVTRVASNIVTGVGFLGGGAIVKYGASVKGLTTAASMWVTAAVGLAVGLGEYTMALVTTGALLLSLVGLRAPRRWLRARVGTRKQAVIIKPRASDDIGAIVGFLHRAEDVTVHSLTVRKEEGESYISVDLRSLSGGDVQQCISELSARDDVHDISYAD